MDAVALQQGQELLEAGHTQGAQSQPELGQEQERALEREPGPLARRRHHDGPELEPGVMLAEAPRGALARYVAER